MSVCVYRSESYTSITGERRRKGECLMRDQSVGTANCTLTAYKLHPSVFLSLSLSLTHSLSLFVALVWFDLFVHINDVDALEPHNIIDIPLKKLIIYCRRYRHKIIGSAKSTENPSLAAPSQFSNRCYATLHAKDNPRGKKSQSSGGEVDARESKLLRLRPANPRDGRDERERCSRR